MRIEGAGSDCHDWRGKANNHYDKSRKPELGSVLLVTKCVPWRNIALGSTILHNKKKRPAM
jgi:hypothetical protein